ncbi:YggS family pyridoxal phosphate-dependent enzyme [Hellea balneolensis]|uniref:YggS family pyridoxal phosphate-dependent enzyme n=1 Tax=Hellea balneolensis TaxID=287478 RepID=UPI00041570E2|nr:YggS family pyridoxal phosphate-dependent enzyme [Hellea balneolensis]
MSDELPISKKRDLILERMAEAAKRAERSDSQVLVAVSKVQPDDRIAQMLAAGQTVFGENRVQEAQKRWGESFAENRKEIELRLIGPLQTNKAEDAIRLFDVIETLDREKLAKAFIKAADKVGRMPRLLVQVNTGEEEQKAGISPKELAGFLTRLKRNYDITPEGLMCIPPVGEAASPHFWLLKKLADEHGLKTISMGMSGDFETAIEMGATHVRIGSALFGDRDYN